MQAEEEGGATTELIEEMWNSGDKTCYLCGTAIDTTSHFLAPTSRAIDHITPISRGGKHDLDNLAFACRKCNLRKCNKTPEEYRAWRARHQQDAPQNVPRGLTGRLQGAFLSSLTCTHSLLVTRVAVGSWGGGGLFPGVCGFCFLFVGCLSFWFVLCLCWWLVVFVCVFGWCVCCVCLCTCVRWRRSRVCCCVLG